MDIDSGMAPRWNSMPSVRNRIKNSRVRSAGAIQTSAAAEPTEVRVVGVSKSFGRLSVFQGLSFSVRHKELAEVIGPTGSGKTTLLRLMHGQLRPNAGEVWVKGHPVHRRWRRGLNQVRRHVAFIFQEERLLRRLNALENVVVALQVTHPELPSGVIRQRALAALESVALADRAHAMPHELSAGQRQRVAIARALVTRPEVLLADEPLAALDDESAEKVVRLFEAATSDGMSIVVASHHHAFSANRILHLPSGKVYGKQKRATAAMRSHARSSVGRHARSRERPGRPEAGASPPPLWRRSVAYAANAWRLVVLNGLRSWRRDARLIAPVLGTISLLLVLCGTLALIGLAVEQAVASEATQASIVRVYLAPDASPAAIAGLQATLQDDPRVATVTEITPEQALAEADGTPGLDALASLSSTNPFPASLDVQVKLVTDVAAVARSASSDPAVDPSYPTSYDPDAYGRLRHFALVAGGVASGILVLFITVGYAVVANSMRGVAAARRDEVTVTRLLGARGWMLRGPFAVEGMTTGALAGALAAAIVGAVWQAAVRFESSVYTQVLPGVDVNQVRYVLAAIIAAGLLLGATTAALGFRKAAA